MIQSLGNFTFVTTLDLSMGYYHLPLDEETSNLWRSPARVKLFGVDTIVDLLDSILRDANFLPQPISQIAAHRDVAMNKRPERPAQRIVLAVFPV